MISDFSQSLSVSVAKSQIEFYFLWVLLLSKVKQEPESFPLCLLFLIMDSSLWQMQGMLQHAHSWILQTWT